MYFGIDIGGTSAKIGAFENDKLVKTWEISMSFKSLDEMVKAILASLSEVAKNIEGIGLDAPGFIKDNVISSAANLHFLDGVNLKEAFEKEARTKVRVINDANAHALGEAKSKNKDNILFVTLGTGVGGGFVINGKVLEGSDGAFMELGHMHVDDFYNFSCGCGQVGCLETLCAQKGVNNLVNYYKKSCETKLADSYTVKDVFDLARQKDPLCLKVFEVFTDKLGLALSNAAIILNPGEIIIGGGISLAGNFLLDEVTRTFKKYGSNVIRNTKISLATLGNKAGIYGAYYLIKEA